jgi:chemotaxis protein CheZ
MQPERGMVAMMEMSAMKTRLDQARDLVRHLEAGDADKADAVVQAMVAVKETHLFQELGRLTRELHEAINGFLLDERLEQLARQEIPDATERLRYVISMTEESANTTLAAVEASLPLVDDLQRRAAKLGQDWSRFRGRELPVEEFRVLVAELAEFLGAVGSNGERLHGKLSEVLMAQGFQDLTGQIIRKVIGLVQNVEDKLVDIIRLSGQRINRPDRKPAEQLTKHGPSVPGVDTAEAVQGQDEVDDLLSSLGF